MFSGVRERMYWEQMGEKIRKTTSLQVQTNLNYTGNGSGSNYQIQFGFIIPKQWRCLIIFPFYNSILETETILKLQDTKGFLPADIMWLLSTQRKWKRAPKNSRWHYQLIIYKFCSSQYSLSFLHWIAKSTKYTGCRSLKTPKFVYSHQYTLVISTKWKVLEYHFCICT